MDPRTFYAAAVHEARKIRQPHAADFDDLVQEGAIAYWRAVKDRDLRDPKPYGGVAMRHRINEVGPRQKAHFGHVGAGSKVYEPLRHADKLAPAEAVVESAVPDAPDGSDVVQILRDTLDEREREIVYRKFWLDQDDKTISAAMGISPLWARNLWQQKIKPRLRIALAECL